MLLRDNKLNAKKITLVGVLSAIAVITVYFESILPVNKLALLVLSSLFVSIIVIEAGIKTSFLFYIVTSVLIFIIIPKKTALIPYVLFFGHYGIFKYYVEKIKKLMPELILKLIFFNVCFYIIYFVLNSIFLPDIQLPIYIVVIILQFLFVLYDYIYTRIIQYYRDKIRSKLKLGIV